MSDFSGDPKPCRCCGTIPKPRAWHRDVSLWIIECELYACNSTWRIISDDLDSAVRAWNELQEESCACKFFVPKLPPLKENEARIIPVKKPYIEQHEDERMFIEHDKYGCVSACFIGKADDYQHLAEFTARHETNQEKALTEHLMGLAGESGEAIDILKKHLFQGHDLDKEHLAEELGDVAWYLAMAAHELGYSLSDIFRLNIEKLIARYPNGFDPERSIKRDE